MTSNWIVEPAAAPLRGDLRVPSDKSISHRAVMLAALAPGDSLVERPLLGEDVGHTIAAMRMLGAQVTRQGEHLQISGETHLHQPDEPIYCGNAGTLIRLLAGALCGRGLSCVLSGDESLNRRPMRRIAEPLAAMGASIKTAAAGTPPVTIGASENLKSIEYRMPVASAQVKSALLLAGLSADQGAAVIEPAPCRDHTERMLPAFGAQVSRAGARVAVAPCRRLRPAHISVPADPSSAAFFIVAASIVAGSELVLREVGINPTRAGALGLLRRMGAQISTSDPRKVGDEPVVDIRVRSAELHAIDIGAADIPAAIDELPVLLAAAAVASGTTTVAGAAELRAKESDRIAAMAALLRNLGIDCQEKPDGIVVVGGQPRGGHCDSQSDHRIAMAAATLALRCKSAVHISDCANVATSFPGFRQHAAATGWKIDDQDRAGATPTS